MVESALRNQRERLGQLRADAERLETVVTGARTLRRTLSQRADRMRQDSEQTRSDDEIAETFDRFLQQQFPPSVLGDPVGELPFDEFVSAVQTFLTPDGEPVDPTDVIDDGTLGLDWNERFLERRWDRIPIRVADQDADRQAAVAALRSLLTSVDPDGAAQLANCFGTVVDNAAAERDRVRTEIDQVKQNHAATLESADQQDIDPMEALSWDAPIAMLPVRLETRFVDASGGVDGPPAKLRVRIYPEQFHVDSHEPELTAREREWGRTFWARLWLVAHDLPKAVAERDNGLQPADVYDPSRLPADLRGPVADLFTQLPDFSGSPSDRFEHVRNRAWGRGVESFGRERAAWIVHALGPIDQQGQRVDATLLSAWGNDEPPFAPNAPPRLRFPSVPDKPDAWSRQPHLRLMPDRWVVRAHWTDRNGTEHVERATSNRIKEPLHVAPDPSDLQSSSGSSSTSVAGDGTEWMVEYGRAESVGMAVTVDLPSGFVPDDGFSLVEVTGLRTSADRASTAEELEELVAAHHYTDGLSLLSPGTPTNNADEPSGRSSRRNPPESGPIEAGPPLVTQGDGSDADLTATGLGIEPDGRDHVFAHVEGADERHAATAGDLQRVLWPATLGYYAKHLFPDWDWSALYDTEPGLPDGERPVTQEIMGQDVLSWLDAYRSHFAEFVRADGPLGTIRAGKQPYGILPVTPFDTPPSSLGPELETDDDGDGHPTTDIDDPLTWTPTYLADIDDDDIMVDLIERLWGLRDTWHSAAEKLPTVADDDTEQALLDALGQEATASRYRRRAWLLDDSHPLFGPILDDDRFDVSDTQVSTALSQLGVPQFDARLDDLLTLGLAVSADSEELPLVDDDIDTYLQLLSTMLADAEHWSPTNPLRALGTDPDSGTIEAGRIALARGWILWRYERRGFDDVALSADESLLRQLLLVAVQRACASSRLRLGVLYGDPSTVGPEPTAYDHGERTVYDDLADPVPGQLENHPSLSAGDDYEDAIGAIVDGDRPQLDPVLASFAGSLDRLGQLDPGAADLDRIARGAMDLCSHRLDAWWTSVATRRLEQVREREDDVHVGAYGHVTDLTPDPDTEAEYLLAPSQNQATTASILRNGHKANAGGPHGETLAVDLSAERIQRVWPYLSGVRNGSSLSELVGYRFERGLHDISEDTDNGVNDAEQYIAPFRQAYPSLAGRLDHGGTEPGDVDLSAASEVVDGMEVYRDWQDDDIDWGDPLPGPNSDARAEIEALLRAIDDEMGAITDLLVAESIHQLATGNPDRASAALEALSRGELMQDPAVLDTPRTQTGVTHRLMVLFGNADSIPTPRAWQVPYRDLLAVEDLPDAFSLPYVDRSSVAEPIDPDLLDPSTRSSLLGGSSSSGTTALESVSVRNDAEPALDGWVGDLLPAPDRVGCQAAFQWSAERTFATGSIAVPGKPERVTVDDVGFEPDLVVFTASTGVETITESVGTAPTIPGWLHGTATVDPDGRVTQQSTSVAVGPTESQYVADSDAAIHTALRTPDGRAGTITAQVRKTTSEGFHLQFQTVDTPTEGTLSIGYTAVKTGDRSEIRAGSFVAQPPSESELDDEQAATQTVDLGVDADHVRLTGTTATDAPDASGSVAAAAGLSRGVAVDDDGIDQTVASTATDPANGDNARTVAEDAVLDLLYPAGGRVDGRTTASVTRLENSELELTYNRPDESVPWDETPRLVTYVAVDSATHESSDGVIGGPPEIGTVTVPTETDRVTVETEGRPAQIAITGVSGVPTADDGSLPSAPSMPAGQAAWSEGVAVGSDSQTVRGHAQGSNGGARYGSNHHVVSIPQLDSDGAVAGHTRGKVVAVTDDGFQLRFSTAPTDGDGTRTVLTYEAWPTAPDERAFAVADDCRLDELDLAPLDAVALTQSQEEAAGSALERRIGYHLFRNRPRNRPPVPDGAELALSFQDVPQGADVSVGAFIEHARAVTDLIGDARPATATDLAHPTAAGDDGYLTSGSASSQPTAKRLASRADDVADELTDVEAMIANRLATLDGDGPTLVEMARQIGEAATELAAAAPLSQLVDTVDRLASYAEPNGRARSLPAELREIAAALRAGPTEPSATATDRRVEPEHGTTVTIETGLPRTDVTVTLGSTSEPALWEQASVRTDGDGVAAVTVDLDGLPHGTGLLMTASADETLDEALVRALGRLPVDEQADLVRAVAEEYLDPEEDADLVDALEAYEDFDQDRREELLAQLPAEAKLEILAELGLEEQADRFARRLSAGDGRVPEILATRSIRIAPAQPQPSGLPSLFAEDLVIVPRLFWLRRLLTVLDPARSASRAAVVDEAVVDADWDGLRAESELADRVAALTDAAGDTALTSADQRAIAALLELESHELDTLAGAIDAVVEPLDRLGVTAVVSARGNLSRPWAQQYVVVADPGIESPLGRGPRGEVRGRIRSYLAAPNLELPEEFGGFHPGLRSVLVRDVGDPDAAPAARAIAALVRDPSPVVNALENDVEQPHLLVRDLTALTSHPETFATHGNAGDFRQRLTDAIAALKRNGSRPAALFTARTADAQELIAALDNAVPELTTYALDVENNGPPSYGSGPANTAAHRHHEDLGDLDDAVDLAVRNRLRPLIDGRDPATAFRKAALEALRRAMIRATYVGVYGATPQSATGGEPADADALVTQARAVGEELRDRRTAANAYDPDTAAAEPTVDGQTARLDALLGDEFTVLPPFAPTNPTEIRSAFAASDQALAGDAYAVDTWLQRIARVRDHPALFRDVRTYADALALAGGGDTADDLAVGQLGHDSVDWIGRDGETPSGGEISIVADFGSWASQNSRLPQTPGRNGQPPIAGLVIDGWVDPMPATEETIGIGLQYDDPGARAPQSALLAVPPAWERDDESWTPTGPVGWSREELQTTLAETRELVELRGVDLDALEDLGHMLPGLVFPYNDTTVGGSNESVPDAPSVRFNRFDWWHGSD